MCINYLFTIYKTGGWEDALKIIVFRVFTMEEGNLHPVNNCNQPRIPLVQSLSNCFLFFALENIHYKYSHISVLKSTYLIDTQVR